jgi:integrase/recombinase XerD
MALRQFFRHLEKSDVILLDPCAKMVLPKLGERLPRNVLTPAEAVRILNMPDTQRPIGIRDRAILELFYSTGIRLEEMTRLTIHDVDARNGFLRVNRGKFAKDRVVPMGRKACDYVREYLAKVRAVWTQARREERAMWLSSYRPHLPLKKQLIEIMVTQYGRKAGLTKRVYPHAWRHACATHLVAAGSNVAYVQRLLGHRSIATTQIYTRVSVPDVRKAVGKAHPRARSDVPASQLPAHDHDTAPRFFSRSL